MLSAAQETDTRSSANRSSSGSIGATFGGKGGVTVTATGQASRGNSSGTDVTNIESALSAGRGASVTTPDALTLGGSTLTGESVNVRAGALTIESLQDTSTFTSRQNSAGGSLSVDVTTGQVSGSANYGRERQNGNFASVETQAGITTGSGGYTIDVRGDPSAGSGQTVLIGGVIASSATDTSRNTLTTGTLTARDVQNRETYSASSTNLSGGLSVAVGGTPANGTTPTTAPASGVGAARDGTATANEATTTRDVPGVNLGNGISVSGGLPSAMGASGSQSGTTNSAIAAGTITIRPSIIGAGSDGVSDAASQAVANSISRDTATANDGALTQEFDAAKQAEIQEAFRVTRETANQTAVFFANRAAEETAKRKEHETGVDARGTPLTQAQRDQALVDANNMRENYGSGSPIRILATAFNAAASGGNAAGGLGSLAQGAVVNVLQSLAVTEMKRIADGLMTETYGTDAQGNRTLTRTQNATSEGVRAALQAITACAGAAAGGSSCGGAALGASTSVVIGALINQATGNNSATYNLDGPTNPDGTLIHTNPRSLEQQQAITQLIGTLAGAVAAATGVDAPSAVSAATIEVENNQNIPRTSPRRPGIGHNGGPPTENSPVRNPNLSVRARDLLLQSRSIDEYDIALNEYRTAREEYFKIYRGSELTSGKPMPYSELVNAASGYRTRTRNLQAVNSSLPTNSLSQTVSDNNMYYMRNEFLGTGLGITLNGKPVQSARYDGTTRVVEGLTQREIFEIYRGLIGGTMPTAIQEKPAGNGKHSGGTRYTASTRIGNVTLRNYSASAAESGAKWIIDAPFIKPTGESVTVKVKFK